MIKNIIILFLVVGLILQRACEPEPEELPVKVYHERVEYDNGILELDFSVQGELLEWLIDVPECPQLRPQRGTDTIYITLPPETTTDTLFFPVVETDTVVFKARYAPRQFIETVETDNGPATLEILIAGNTLLSWSIELPEVIEDYFPNIDTVDIIDKNNRWFVQANGGASFDMKRGYVGAGAGFVNNKNILGLSVNYDGQNPFFLLNYARIIR